MTQKFSKITNPLTIIGIFAVLSEIAMTTALGIVDKSLQSTFLWFVMGFPVLLISFFFLTLNFNPKVLYAPSDFKDENLFVQTIKSMSIESSSKTNTKEKTEQIKGKTFTNETMTLDNKHFFDCKFNHCTMVFEGKGNLHLSNCGFYNCRWSLTEYAANVVSFMSSMYLGLGEDGKKVVEETFENIKSGMYLKG